jgi:hypothetical protein
MEPQETAEIIHLDRSPASEIIGSLRLQDAITMIEGRLASLELDVERLSASTEDDVKKTSGELSVMRAHVNDALDAVSQTAEGLRAEVSDLVHGALPPSPDEVIDDVIDGVGDAMRTMAEAVEARISALSHDLGRTKDAVERIATVVGGLLNRFDRLEQFR